MPLLLLSKVPKQKIFLLKSIASNLLLHSLLQLPTAMLVLIVRCAMEVRMAAYSRQLSLPHLLLKVRPSRQPRICIMPYEKESTRVGKTWLAYMTKGRILHDINSCWAPNRDRRRTSKHSHRNGKHIDKLIEAHFQPCLLIALVYHDGPGGTLSLVPTNIRLVLYRWVMFLYTGSPLFRSIFDIY